MRIIMPHPRDLVQKNDRSSAVIYLIVKRFKRLRPILMASTVIICLQRKECGEILKFIVIRESMSGLQTFNANESGRGFSRKLGHKRRFADSPSSSARYQR